MKNAIRAYHSLDAKAEEYAKQVFDLYEKSKKRIERCILPSNVPELESDEFIGALITLPSS